jgi:hypothetical protein
MRRWVFTILSVASLIVFVTAIGMWWRSYSSSDFVWTQRGTKTFEIITARGQCLFKWTSGAVGDARNAFNLRRDAPQDLVRGNWLFWAGKENRTFLGVITWGRSHYGGSGTGMSIMLPYWLIALLAAIAPAVWLVKFARARRRVQSGHCPTCGYDLRASPDRCPECGAIPLRRFLLELWRPFSIASLARNAIEHRVG